jgi:hypothetical protein
VIKRGGDGVEIPDDLRAYLAVPANRTLTFDQGEAREITLFAPEELTTRTFDVSTADFALQEGWDGWDRMKHKKYEFLGVDLVKECRNYFPEGIMVWFPELGMYGQWDSDHHKIIVFPDVTWSDIMKDPQPYFNAQWYPDRVPCLYLRPWEDESTEQEKE